MTSDYCLNETAILSSRCCRWLGCSKSNSDMKIVESHIDNLPFTVDTAMTLLPSCPWPSVTPSDNLRGIVTLFKVPKRMAQILLAIYNTNQFIHYASRAAHLRYFPIDIACGRDSGSLQPFQTRNFHEDYPLAGHPRSHCSMGNELR